MSKLLITTVCALLALPVAAIADDDRPPQAHYRAQGGHPPAPSYHGGEHHGDRDDGHRYYGYPGGYRYYGHAGAPRYYYGYPGPPHYYYGGGYYGGGHHHGHDDDDDALWAIGGLVLGGLIVHAVEQASAEASSPAPASSASPQKCRDSVAYDSDGTPYVKRDCK